MNKLVNALGDAYVGGRLSIQKGYSTPGIDVLGQYVYGPTNAPIWVTTNGSFQYPMFYSAPDNSVDAGLYTFTDGSGAGTYDMYQTIYNIYSGFEYTLSMWIKLGTATNFCLVVNNTLAWNTIGGKCFTSADGLSTTDWTKVFYTFTGVSGNKINLHLGAHLESMTQQTAGDVYIWNIEITTNEKTLLKSPFIPEGINLGANGEAKISYNSTTQSIDFIFN